MFREGFAGLIVVAGAMLSGAGCQGNASGDSMSNQDIVGTWACQAVRAQNLSQRPITFQFHADGTATYSSGTNVSNSGFNSRGNGYGDWKKVGPQNYNLHAQEIVRLNGNAAGRFLVDGTYHLRTASEMTSKTPDQLCAGTTGEDTCPTANYARLTRFSGINQPVSQVAIQDPATNQVNYNDPITGEVDVLNTGAGGNGVVQTIIRCNRIDAVTEYGSSTPVFPLPSPTP
jgi:hypothetical protein